MPSQPACWALAALVLDAISRQSFGRHDPGEVVDPYGIALRSIRGFGYRIESFVRNSWASVIGSLVITAIVWGYVLVGGGA